MQKDESKTAWNDREFVAKRVNDQNKYLAELRARYWRNEINHKRFLLLLRSARDVRQRFQSREIVLDFQTPQNETDIFRI